MTLCGENGGQSRNRSARKGRGRLPNTSREIREELSSQGVRLKKKVPPEGERGIFCHLRQRRACDKSTNDMDQLNQRKDQP